MHFLGLSKVAGCRRKLPPTWLISAGYSAWHFFTGWHFLNKIYMDWPLTLTTQPSTSKLSDNSAFSFFFSLRGGGGALEEGVKTRYVMKKAIKLNIYSWTSIEQLYSIIESRWPRNNFIKRSPPSSSQLHAQPPFGHPNKGSPIFANLVYKRASSAWYTLFGFILTVWWRKLQSKIKGDNWLWTSNAAFVACLFQLIETKIMFSRPMKWNTNISHISILSCLETAFRNVLLLSTAVIPGCYLIVT